VQVLELTEKPKGTIQGTHLEPNGSKLMQHGTMVGILIGTPDSNILSTAFKKAHVFIFSQIIMILDLLRFPEFIIICFLA